MKKRVIIFFCAMIVLLTLPICFIFADEECNHTYSDDGDCTTPVTCTVCNDVIILETEHDYSTTLSYTFNKDEDGTENFLLGGTRRVKCSNDNCSSEIDEDVQPFISPLGYSIKEDTYTTEDYEGNIEETTSASIISTYFFNVSAIEDYAKCYNLDITYSTILYLQDLLSEYVCGECDYEYDGKIPVIKVMGGKEYTELVETDWKDVPETYVCPECGAAKSSFFEDKAPPISETGRLHQSVLMPSEAAVGRINDIAIKHIYREDYNEAIVITAFMIIENDIYYIQSDKLISDHTEIVGVTCNKIFEKLAEK